MKPLYTLHHWTGKVVKVTDNTWAEIGAVQGFVQPRLGANMSQVWFNFDGALHCAFVGPSKTVVSKLGSGDLHVVDELDTEEDDAAWSNTVSYAGGVAWLERVARGASYVYLFDGTLKCYEVAGFPASDTFRKGLESYRLYNVNGVLEARTSGVWLGSELPAGSFVRGASRVKIKFDGGVAQADVVDAPFELADSIYLTGALSLHTCNDTDYAITEYGWLKGRGVNKDLRVTSPTPIYVDELGNLRGKALPRQLVGARVTNNAGAVETIISAANSKVLIPSLAAGEYTYAPGLVGGSIKEANATVNPCVLWINTLSGFVCLVLGNGEAPSVVIEHNTTTGKLKTYALENLNITSAAVAYDANIHQLRVVYVDTAYNLKASVFSLSAGKLISTVALWSLNSSCILNQDCVAAFSAVEPYARIASVEWEGETGEMRIGVVSRNATRKLEYLVGSDWRPARAVAVTPDGFVHLFRKDEPTFVGDVIYRLTYEAKP